ncbi:unnamed protein product [Phaedon cochleariae]|uniref:Double jelly roll-like domain-containing protein n=1 Tax=Phaedon cochleariae TaxID=80249 RepID=A0A9N9X486_PHACE|nr:unnamed protein product [Phaedon cochleariae]
MKSMISYGDSNAKFLETVGWGIDSENQPILDKSSHIFSGKLPLKYLMGFAEDYNKGILNVKQELILIIARSFKNCYIGEVDASVEINKIEWKIGHIMPSDKQRLKLLNRLNKSSTAKVKIAYRMWDLYELPSIRETSSDIWAVKTTNSLERPRYIMIGFQNSGNTDNRSKDTTQFIHAGVNNIRLYLNSEVYPYERWNLDFGKKLDAVAYYAYDNFQRSYYGKDMSEPMMSIEEFRKNPLFIIDCSHQPDTLTSSTVDIKLEFETRQSKFPSNTKEMFSNLFGYSDSELDEIMQELENGDGCTESNTRGGSDGSDPTGNVEDRGVPISFTPIRINLKRKLSTDNDENWVVMNQKLTSTNKLDMRPYIELGGPIDDILSFPPIKAYAAIKSELEEGFQEIQKEEEKINKRMKKLEEDKKKHLIKQSENCSTKKQASKKLKHAEEALDVATKMYQVWHKQMSEAFEGDSR